jgi:hypothetical protein
VTFVCIVYIVKSLRMDAASILVSIGNWDLMKGVEFIVLWTMCSMNKVGNLQRRVVQRRPPVFVRGVHVSAIVEQQPHDVLPAALNRSMQYCRVSIGASVHVASVPR